ncbi:MAG TPA: IS110 family transposase [Isosphaeraceae bacterium]
MTTILGIDLGKFKSVACLSDGETGEDRLETVRTDPDSFRELLTRTAPALVLFETSTAAGWVHDLCRELGLPCRVVNPLGEAWQWKKVKRKTDRDDALKLVRLHRMNALPTAHMPPPEVRQRRSLVAFRQRLIAERTAIRNHVRAVFQARGLALPPGHRAWSAAARAEWGGAYARPIGECSPAELWRGELHVDLALLEALEAQVAEVEKALGALGAKDEGVGLLTTIPGVGIRTAEAVAAYLDDAGRFRSAREVSAYAGLVPRQFQSGEMDRKGGITKRGPAPLRKLLVECAWLMRRHNAWAAGVVDRISRGQKGRVESAVVALARKLLVRCWAMLRKGEPWRPPGVSPAAA